MVGTVSKVFSRVIVKNVLIILGTILIFFVSIQLMAAGFGHLGQGLATSIIEVTSNPFIALFIGLLITAIIQSSSTTTSMVVALVASGSISLEQAIPIIIGANIGTTITSTIVSLSYITKTAEFRKAITAGTVHDLFNILLAVILLPLELNYQFLSSASYYIADAFPWIYEGKSEFIGFSRIFDPIGNLMIHSIGAIFTILVSFLLLISTVKLISSQLYNQWIGQTKTLVDNAIFSHKYKSFGLGLIITSIVQSSSLTTSLMVPMVATGKVKISRAFEFILGANLGTTITAILAALFKSEAAMSLAVAHFLFNLIGVLLFMTIPFLEKITTNLADKLGYLTLRNRITGFVYILFTFFIIPFGLIYFSTQLEEEPFKKVSQVPEVEKTEGALDD